MEDSESDDRPFWRRALHWWVYVVTSTALAAILWLVGFSNIEVPIWIRWAVFLIGTHLALYLAGQHVYELYRKERKKRLEEASKHDTEIARMEREKAEILEKHQRALDDRESRQIGAIERKTNRMSISA